MEPNRIFTWSLVCLHVRIPDVISLFKTCRDLRSLSEKPQMWSNLMRRDFPEHFPLAKPEEMAAWFKDLYQFGAFFAIQTSIPLYPYGIICIASGLQTGGKRLAPDSGKVLTTRGRTSEYNFLRLPHQNYVSLMLKTALHDYQTVYLPNVDPREVNYCRVRSLATVFLHSRDEIRHFEMSKISPWCSTQFDDIVNWMVKHFEVQNSDYDDGEIEFIGRLRKGHILEPTSPGLSESLWATLSKFKFKRNIFRSDKFNAVHIYSYLANSNFPSVDGEVIPSWRKEEKPKNSPSV